MNKHVADIQTILVTGAGGFLGKHLINALLKKEEYKVFAFDLSKELLAGTFSENNAIKFYDYQDFEEDEIPFNDIDLVIHLAFGRAHKGVLEVAKSLSFTNTLCRHVFKSCIPYLINISSQEVYGFGCKKKRIENDAVAPKTAYGMAKYASEIITDNVCAEGKTNTSNIRLAALLGPETDSRMVNKFVKNAIEGKPINIVGGAQTFSQLDVRDAAEGIVALLQTDPKNWKSVYNLGYHRSYSITEIAETVVKVARNFNCPEVKIYIERTDEMLYAEMDSSLFYTDTKWQPKYDMEAILDDIFEYQIQLKSL